MGYKTDYRLSAPLVASLDPSQFSKQWRFHWANVVVIVLVCGSHHNKAPPTGWLKHQKSTFSLSWRLEVWDHGVGRVGFLRGLSPWLIDGLLFLRVVFFPLCLCPNSSSCKDTSPIESGPTRNLNLITSLKTQSPNMVTFWGTRVRISTYGFGKGTIQPVAVIFAESHSWEELSPLFYSLGTVSYFGILSGLSAYVPSPNTLIILPKQILHCF